MLVAGQSARLIAIVALLPAPLNRVVNHSVFTLLLLWKQLQLMSLAHRMLIVRPTSPLVPRPRAELAALTELRLMRSLQMQQRVLGRRLTLL